MEEQTFHVGHRERLFARFWTAPNSSPRGLVLCVHGLGEHGGRYAPVAERLTAAGWAALALDLPGHGHSPGRRGHIASYDALLRDLAFMRHQLEQRLPGLPQIMLGHSMGGNLVINYVLRRQRFEPQLPTPCQPLRGFVLSGPMFLPHRPPPRPQILAAWLTGYLVPWLTVRAPVDFNKLSRAPENAKRIERDPLMHGRISVYLATQLLSQGRYALDHANFVDLPGLVMHGQADPITDCRASEAFAIRAGGQVRFIPFPEMLHEIFHEQRNDFVFDSLLSWLDAQVPS